MISKRLLTLAVGLALTAAACSSATDSDTDNSASDDEVAAEEQSETSVSTDESSDDEPADGESASDEDPVRTPLVSPTETDRPFDLNGGASSGTEAFDVVTDDPFRDLEIDVREATAGWPTDWTQRSINLEDLQLGIPTIDPRDRIPPIDVPKFEPIAEATWLAEQEPGALVQYNGETRFYPLSILTRHEIVNDRYGDLPVVVSYCPLCNTALSFDARVDGEVLRFGVSGLLRNSDLVMWDEGTTTLWQQVTGESVVGALAGTQLDLIPTSIVSYGEVLENFPEALSLSTSTGLGVTYGTNSYAGYSSSDRPFLFDGELDPRFPALSRVVGVSINDEDKAFPFERLTGAGAINDVVGGTAVAVLWGGNTADALDARSIADGAAIGTAVAFDRSVDGQTLTFSPTEDGTFTDAETSTTWTLLGRATDGPLAGQQLATVTHRNEFWFAWAAFFPEAEVYGDR